MLMFTYWLNYEYVGPAPGAYHVLNIWLHFLNSLLVFFLVRRIAGWAETDPSKLNLLSLFAAALFLLHPMQTEAVAYIAGRSDVLSCFLILAAFTIFVYRFPGRISVPWVAAILLFFGLACGAKEDSVVLPALLLFTDCFWTSKGQRWARILKNRILYGTIAVLGLAGGAYVLRILATAPTAGFSIRNFTWYQYFFTELRALWVYLRLFVVPYGQNIDHDFPVSQTLLQHGALFGLIGLALAIWLAWRYRREYPLASYGFFVFLILLAPTSSVVPILDPLVERRLYLPMIGLLFVVFEGLRRLAWGKVELSLLLMLILGVDSVLAYQRNVLWSNPIALWQDAVSKAPLKARPHFWLAHSLLSANQCQGAVQEYATAAKLLPVDLQHPTGITAGLLENWGLAYRCLGKPKQAIEKLYQAATIHPAPKLYAQIGMIYGEAGAWTQALDFLHRALKLDPGYEQAYVYLGNLYLQIKQPDTAAGYFLQAIALDPADQYANNALVISRYRAAAQKSHEHQGSDR